jgi:hypothetical protein
MTPKEKAKELFDKFWRETPQPYTERVEYYKESKLIFNDWDKDWTNRLAKQCALIAVDEIIASNPIAFDEDDNCIEKNWWKEVKQEIEKL